MFLCVKRVNKLQLSSVKKYCKERIEAKGGICMSFLKININKYLRLL